MWPPSSSRPPPKTRKRPPQGPGLFLGLGGRRLRRRAGLSSGRRGPGQVHRRTCWLAPWTRPLTRPWWTPASSSAPGRTAYQPSPTGSRRSPWRTSSRASRTKPTPAGPKRCGCFCPGCAVHQSRVVGGRPRKKRPRWICSLPCFPPAMVKR